MSVLKEKFRTFVLFYCLRFGCFCVLRNCDFYVFYNKYVTFVYHYVLVAQKLELIEKLEGGVTVARVCEIYRVKKQTVSDIRKKKA
jgi:hypothetical protein